MHKAQAEHTRWAKYEESILRQKANVRWLDEGDTNSKYFHAIINDRRRRSTLHRIMNQHGEWITRDNLISEEAVNHFSNLFTSEGVTNLHHLDCISR